MKHIRKGVRFLKAWLLGAVGCQSFLGAMVVTGWSYRFCRRRMIGYWQKKAGVPEPYRSPRWVLSERDIDESWWSRVKWCFGSLKANFVSGLGHVLTAFLITLVPGILLAFAWWGGWNNSFNKGYEQAGVGPGLGLLGIFLMALALLYLPMAQAHQAACGKVGAAFEFRQVARLIRRSPWGSLLLGILTALCGFPLVFSSLYLSTAAATQPDLLELPPVQIVSFLNTYYFFWALLFVFPAFFVLRIFAARLYAAASWALALQGRYSHPVLNDIVVTRPPALCSRGRKYWRRCWKTAVFATAYAALVVFAALPLLSQFSATVPVAKRWLIHPMVQMPMYRHIPEPLEKAAQSAFAHEEGGFITWLDDQE